MESPIEPQKNYRKWYVKKRYIIPLGLVAVLLIAGIASFYNQSPIERIGEDDGIIIDFSDGTIYGYKDDPEKKYYIVIRTVGFTRKQMAQMVFFKAQEEAETAGYKPSEQFKKGYPCVKFSLNPECPKRY